MASRRVEVVRLSHLLTFLWTASDLSRFRAPALRLRLALFQ